jgi:5-methylcytosine-specific restriction endonuclease McrA
MLRRTPLRRRKPLRTKSTLKTTKMQRKRSAKARVKEFPRWVRETVLERSNGMCERCGIRRIAHLHHAVYRSQGGTGELSNAIGLCIHCHEAAHSSREVREWCVVRARELAGGM